MKKYLLITAAILALFTNIICAATVTLAWNASADVRVVGYKIYYGNASRIYTNSIDAFTNSLITISNILPGTTYYFAATGYDTNRIESIFSNEALYTPPLNNSNNLVSTISFPFNEGAGMIVSDISTNNLIGTNNATTWVNGKYGKALSFNGASSYINLGNPNVLKLTNSMTLEAWIYPTANPVNDGQIISKSSGSILGFQFKTSPDTGVRTFAIAVAVSSSANSQRYSQTIYTLNNWYHVAGVFNAMAGTLDIYVNGILNNGMLRGAAIPHTQFDAPLNVLIGKRTDGYLFIGTIDEVRIYNRALSQTEIQYDMNNPISNITSNNPPNYPTNIRIINN